MESRLQVCKNKNPVNQTMKKTFRTLELKYEYIKFDTAMNTVIHRILHPCHVLGIISNNNIHRVAIHNICNIS